MFFKRTFQNKTNPSLGFEITHHRRDQIAATKELFQPSTRDYFSLLWFKQGSGQYYIDFNKYSFVNDTLVIVSKDQLHYFVDQGREFEFLEISFTEDFISLSSHEIILMLSFCIREHYEGKQILEIGEQDAFYLNGILDQLEHISHEWSGVEKTESMFHLLQLFLIYCKRLQKNHQSIEIDFIPDGYNDVVGSFTSLLEQNFKKIQKVNYYCDRLNITYTSLAKYTKSYCEKNPKEIIAERVTLEAKRMLSASTLPIKEIAYELGFDEPTNMVKFFKKYSGCTPTQFREQYSAF